MLIYLPTNLPAISISFSISHDAKHSRKVYSKNALLKPILPCSQRHHAGDLLGHRFCRGMSCIVRSRKVRRVQTGARIPTIQGPTCRASSFSCLHVDLVISIVRSIIPAAQTQGTDQPVLQISRYILTRLPIEMMACGIDGRKKLTNSPPHRILLHPEDHPDDRPRDHHPADAPHPIQACQQRPERRTGFIPRVPLRAEDVPLLAIDGHYVFRNDVHSRSQRVASRDRAEAEGSPQTRRAQRDENDELAADHEDEDAQGQGCDLDAGRVPADADGDDDGDDDEAEGEVPVEVVEGPCARAAEGAAGGGGFGEAEGAEGEGVEAYDAEDGGEDGEDVGRFQGGGVVDGEVADQGEDAAGEDEDGGLEGDGAGVVAEVEGDAGDGVFGRGWGCGGGLAVVVGFELGG